jgi:hypothetical protein
MLGLRDTVTLATTKLRVRRLRLTITLIVAGILFTVLCFGSLVIRGSLASFHSFLSEGLLGSFIININQPGDYDISLDPKFIAHAEVIDETRLAKQAAEAKRLGLPFDPKTAPHAVTLGEGPNGKQKYADMDNPSSRQTYLDLVPNDLHTKITKAAQPYQPKALYEAFSFNSMTYLNGLDLAPVIGSEEVKVNRNGAFGPQDAFAAFGTNFTAYDNGLLQPFLLDGTNLDTKPGQPLPIIAPIDAAEKLLGLKPLSTKAKPAERIARLREVRERAKDLRFDVCYRNKTAASLRDQATQQASEITAHAGDASYQKPAVVYDAKPAKPCQPTAITADSRSAFEKTQAAKLDQFNEEFGTPKPVTRLINFRIVGVLPQIGALQTATGPDTIISSFFTTSLGQGWYASRQALLTDPDFKPIMTDPYNLVQGSQEYFLEFPNRPTEKHFLDDQVCDILTGISPVACAKSGKLYALPYGNPIATLYDAQRGFNDFLKIVLTVIGVLSAIVLMGTIGKIIADSRKETSVFRALGAKRHHIAQVYLLYTAVVATLSFCVAVAIGLAGALYVEYTYSAKLGAQAVLAFNSHDLTKPFHLIGLNLLDFLEIYIFILAVSLVSASVPIAGNLRRNPIKDMREE